MDLWSTVSATQEAGSNPSNLRFSIKQSFGGSINLNNDGDDDDGVDEGREDGVGDIEGADMSGGEEGVRDSTTEGIVS